MTCPRRSARRVQACKDGTRRHMPGPPDAPDVPPFCVWVRARAHADPLCATTAALKVQKWTVNGKPTKPAPAKTAGINFGLTGSAAAAVNVCVDLAGACGPAGSVCGPEGPLRLGRCDKSSLGRLCPPAAATADCNTLGQVCGAAGSGPCSFTLTTATVKALKKPCCISAGMSLGGLGRSTSIGGGYLCEWRTRVRKGSLRSRSFRGLGWA